MRSTKRHTGISPETGVITSGGKKPVKYRIRDKGEGKKNHPSCPRYPNDYLKEEFADIPTINVLQLFSEDNYKYLYESAKNYCTLLKVDFQEVYSPKEFRDLYDHFEGILRNGILTLSDNDSRLSFKINEPCCSNTLFFIPCEILDKTTGQFRDILLNFFQILKYVHRLESLQNSYHYEVMCGELEYQEELIEEGRDECFGEIDNDYAKLLKRYKSGDIMKTLHLVSVIPEYSPGDLIEIIDKYTPGDNGEKTLLSIIRRGLHDHLLCEDMIFNYVGCLPEYDPDAGMDIIRASELISIVYTTYDSVLENIIESINASAENGVSEYFCSGQISLTPETDVLMNENKFVKPFLDWVSELIDELDNYKNTIKNDNV